MVRSPTTARPPCLYEPCVEDANGDGGFGGAIYAGYGSTTEFFRRTIWFYSEAASGGALYNLGEVMLYSNGFMRANKAVVRRGDKCRLFGRTADQYMRHTCFILLLYELASFRASSRAAEDGSSVSMTCFVERICF